MNTDPKKPAGLILRWDEGGTFGDETEWYVYPPMWCDSYPEIPGTAHWTHDMAKEPLAGPFDSETEARAALRSLEATQREQQASDDKREA